MLTAFLNYINEQGLFAARHRLLVGVSGGLDSMVLAELCHRAGFRFAVAHAHFGLRGPAADADAAFVAQWAAGHQVEFFQENFPTRAYARSRGLSVQVAARQLRYQWWESLCTTRGFDRVLTAHHLNDSLETLLLNLVRGTGVAGLRGVPARQGAVVRPLGFASRAQLQAFAEKEHIAWVEDASNATDDYARNFVRHRVVPLLRQLNPSLEATFADTLPRLLAAADWAGYLLGSLKDRVLHEKIILLEELEALPHPPEALAELLRPYGFSYRQALTVYARRHAAPGRVFGSATHTLTLDRRRWLLSVPEKDLAPFAAVLSEAEPVCRTPWGQLLLERVYAGPQVPTGPAEVHVAASALQKPLHVRLWQPGDRLQPRGMGGRSQLVSDLLINRKVPLPEKKHVLVVLSGQEIVWVVGHRAAEAHRPAPGDEWVFRLVFSPVTP